MPFEVLAHPINFPMIVFSDEDRFRHSAFVFRVRVAEARTNFEYENGLVFHSISNVELWPYMGRRAYRLHKRCYSVLYSFSLDIVKGHIFRDV